MNEFNLYFFVFILKSAGLGSRSHNTALKCKNAELEELEQLEVEVCLARSAKGICRIESLEINELSSLPSSHFEAFAD